MAATSEPQALLLVDLRELRGQDLEPLFAEEVTRWRDELDWDFRPSADLVRRFVDMRALGGCALRDRRRVVGYCYYVAEERKGLIGDLYVMHDWWSPAREATLLQAALRTLWASPTLKRVESQLMMLGAAPRRAFPYASRLRFYPRNFMVADLNASAPLDAGPTPPRVAFTNWEAREQELAARLIATTYRLHVDADINDQYQSVSGARRFLTNIVQYPGCGSFYQPASWVATDVISGQLVGISLSSLVAFDVGHITQICVDPAWQGAGIGREMIRRSIEALIRNGCRRVSLTVTAANEGAVSLYERLGFRTLRRFDAMVWADREEGG